MGNNLSQECNICIEKKSPTLFLVATSKCKHDKNICRGCVERHIDARLCGKGDVSIQCPFEGCKQIIEHNDVKRIVNRELFERFDTLSLRQALRIMPDFRWCKNSRCGSGQIHYERDDAPIMTCRSCGEKSCYTHDVPWHENMSCQQYEEKRKESEAATNHYLMKHTKPCPKCGTHIEKNGGCNHMTCKIRSCSYEFCWL
ncbi:16537_t:CDS:2 [Dentiscutata heterogama]|uniref:16537_t:CDS:1 n=1 Tax=Dentiscutata heterogama TaxID=1316150 RepID=A0ACA9LC47_9GLOM|nr:16537_t:CDS:2 [Dentiscutata heterogama]